MRYTNPIDRKKWSTDFWAKQEQPSMEKKSNKRHGISKRIRFEVFKRDKFKCQYCGSSAPEVLLQVDHLNPVANGGTNEIINLITACFGCNNGKSDKLISDDSTILKQKEQLEQLQERREQLEMMMNWHEGLKNIQGEIHCKLKEIWEGLAVGYSISSNGLLNIKKWAKTYSFDEIIKAMDTAAEEYLVFENGTVTNESWGIAFNKIPAIIKVTRDSIDKPDLKDFFYIRGIIRNRFENYNPAEIFELLEAARSWGASIDELKKIASRASSWISFKSDIIDLIKKYKEEDQNNSSSYNEDLPF